jgi:selenium-binding protein 1
MAGARQRAGSSAFSGPLVSSVTPRPELSGSTVSGAWDDQFFPDGVGAWMAKIGTDPAAGGLRINDQFFPHGQDFRGRRPHQVRLQGGDASSDSPCYR